jgi:hypothetical protein
LKYALGYSSADCTGGQSNMQRDKAPTLQVDVCHNHLVDLTQFLGDTSHFYVNFCRIKKVAVVHNYVTQCKKL